MGMYTEFWADLWLKPLSSEVEEILQHLVRGEEGWTGKLPAHPFFECRRWYFVCANVNRGPRLSTLKDGYLDIEAHFKNYDDEIAKFLDWLEPWIEEGCVSWQYEERVRPKYRHFSGADPVIYKYHCWPEAEELNGFLWGSAAEPGERAYCGASGFCKVSRRWTEFRDTFACPHCGAYLDVAKLSPLEQLADVATTEEDPEV